MKVLDKNHYQKLEKEAQLQQHEEKLKLLDKRSHYKRQLDEQIHQNKEFKHLSLMTRNEMALNKNDLEAFFKGDVRVNSMVPGINGGNQSKSKMEQMTKKGDSTSSQHNMVNERRSVHDKSTGAMLADKQKRLL